VQIHIAQIHYRKQVFHLKILLIIFSQDLACHYSTHLESLSQKFTFFLAQSIFEILIFIGSYFRHYVIEYFRNQIGSMAKIMGLLCTVCVSHYLYDKEFHYLGTIRVTIIVY